MQIVKLEETQITKQITVSTYIFTFENNAREGE